MTARRRSSDIVTPVGLCSAGCTTRARAACAGRRLEGSGRRPSLSIATATGLEPSIRAADNTPLKVSSSTRIASPADATGRWRERACWAPTVTNTCEADVNAAASDPRRAGLTMIEPSAAVDSRAATRRHRGDRGAPRAPRDAHAAAARSARVEQIVRRLARQGLNERAAAHFAGYQAAPGGDLICASDQCRR